MGTKKSNGQFEIKAVKWDTSTGGEDMDMLLVDHFLAEFDEKHKPQVPAKDSPKAIAKLRKQVRKTKEILSANKEAPLSVEGMHEDVDFRSTISREKFEEMATSVGLFDRAVAPLKAIVELLPEFNITMDDVHVVEVIGGASRVPGVKTALQDALGGRTLDVHLDAAPRLGRERVDQMQHAHEPKPSTEPGPRGGLVSTLVGSELHGVPRQPPAHDHAPPEV
jgi:hypoxia up-regulated 1